MKISPCSLLLLASLSVITPPLLSDEFPPTGSETVPATVIEKVGFDTTQISEDGLIGPAGGLRALSYEFCIPASPDQLAEVQTIDPTAKPQSSPGRIGCQSDQTLMIGSSHQQGFHSVLEALTQLPYIKRIEQAFFE